MHVVEVIKQALPVFKTIADWTPTPWDNYVVTILESALNNPALLDLLDTLFGHHDVLTSKDGLRNAAMMTLAEGKRSAVEPSLPAGINWATLLTYLPLLIRLLLTFAGKR